MISLCFSALGVLGVQSDPIDERTDLPATVSTTTFQSSDYGYIVEVPTGWSPIPIEALDDLVASLVKPGQSLIYDAGFHLAGSAGYFKYPYVLVQVIPYQLYGLRGQPRERELAAAVQALIGINVQEEFDKVATDDAKALLKGVTTTTPILDRLNRRLTYRMTLNNPVMGLIRGDMVGHFGRSALVQVMYYDLENQWDRQLVAREHFFRSFRFDVQHAYDNAKAGGSLLDNRIASAALRGAIIGAVVGGVITLYRKLRGRPASA